MSKPTHLAWSDRKSPRVSVRRWRAAATLLALFACVSGVDAGCATAPAVKAPATTLSAPPLAPAPCPAASTAGAAVPSDASAPSARRPAWPPPPGVVQIALWPGAVPDAPPGAAPEEVTATVTDTLVAGKPWIAVSRVTRPTMTVYSPAGKNTGAAVVVFPGGGYHILAIDLEGTEVCDWLVSKGITCVVLKYRVPGEGNDVPYVEPTVGPHPLSRLALQDAQRAMGLLRSRAPEWGIDPHKLGVLGFSAGGHMVAAISTHFSNRAYPIVDAADQESCRPDFAVALYPGHLSMKPNIYELTRDIPVTRETPPTLIVQSEDDPVDRVENSLVYFAALRKAQVAAELHLYARGGHAFGLRPRAESPITSWPRLVEVWLAASAMIPG